MITLFDDIRFGARALAKSPGFTLASISTRDSADRDSKSLLAEPTSFVVLVSQAVSGSEL